MSLSSFDQGDLVRLGNPSTATGSTAFTDAAGNAATPSTVTLTVRKPDGTLLVYGYPSAGASGTLTIEATGRLFTDVPLNQAGLWCWDMGSTGDPTVLEQASFYVRPRLTQA